MANQLNPNVGHGSWLTYITISDSKISPRVNLHAPWKLIRRAMLSRADAPLYEVQSRYEEYAGIEVFTEMAG